MKDKYIILLKYYNSYWEPYFKLGGVIHCFDYDYAKNLYHKLCKNFSSNQWLLIKVEDNYINDNDFIYMKGE